LKRRKLYLVIPLVVLTPAAYFYAQSLPQRFRAKALVGSAPLTPGEPSPANRVDPSTINAQEELRAVRETLYSPRVLETVAREFGVRPASATRTASDDMKAGIQIQLDGPDTFFVGFESASPGMAAKVANRLAALFVEQTSAVRVKTVAQQDDVLDSEVDRLREQLGTQEEGLKSYKNRVAQELPDRLAANLKELESLHAQIQSRTDQIAEAEARQTSIREEMQALEKQGVLQEDPPAKSSSQVALDDLRLKLAQLKTRYTPQNPEVLRTEREVRDLEAVAVPARPAPHGPSQGQMRYFSLQAELKSTESRLASYRQDQAAPLSQVQEYERRVNVSPGYETAVADRTRDAAMLRARYEALYAKQQEARLTQRTESTRSGFAFKVLEPAEVPDTPYSPHRGRILLFGLAAGLGLGIAGVLVAERLDTTFDTAEAVESFSGIPVLSSIPAIAARPSGKSGTGESLPPRPMANDLATAHFSAEQMRDFKKHRLPVLTDPQSIASQQYGILALKVAGWMRQDGNQVLAITSATGGEGKSLTALNLSLAVASCSQGRVLLIDCDLRLPQVHTRLGLKSAGLSDLLTGGETDPKPYISSLGKLDIMASGSIPANPVNLLASARMRELLSRLRQDYQLIILDSPPVVPIADSHILAGLADGVLFVVRARKTRPDLFRHAIDSLSANNLFGVVLNDVEYASSPYAYAYRYYQQHYLGRS
jgi:polysaccharide chain length determinant protein (PEP-CTERM system associated)